MERWRQAAQDANEKPVLTLKEQKELQRKEKAMAEMAVVTIVERTDHAWSRTS